MPLMTAAENGDLCDQARSRPGLRSPSPCARPTDTQRGSGPSRVTGEPPGGTWPMSPSSVGATGSPQLPSAPQASPPRRLGVRKPRGNGARAVRGAVKPGGWQNRCSPCTAGSHPSWDAGLKPSILAVPAAPGLLEGQGPHPGVGAVAGQLCRYPKSH